MINEIHNNNNNTKVGLSMALINQQSINNLLN